jgi:hypothetical protein
MTTRKHPSVAFWATVVAVCLPLIYVLSFGPACWISSRLDRGAMGVNCVYQPLMRLCCRGDQPSMTLTGDLLREYAECLKNREGSWHIYRNPYTRRYERGWLMYVEVE